MVRFVHLALAAGALILSACGAEKAEPDVKAEVEATSVPVDAFTAADRQELAAIKAKVLEGGVVFEGLPNPPLGLCVGKDEMFCQYEQLKAVREWKAAYSGDYAAQRNVAYCLSNGCDGLRPDSVHGCAWRLVIIDAADPRMGDTDAGNADVECGRLSESGRKAAAAQAARIAETIARQS